MKQRIMLVDDDKISNFVVKRLFNKTFPEVECIIFENPEKAIDNLKSLNDTKPDLILLDINMPEMNGWEFLEIFEKMSTDIPVVMISYTTNPKDFDKTKEYPSVKSLMEKPFNPEKIKNLVYLSH